MQKIKTSHGLTPVCCCCHRIRDQFGIWHEPEKMFVDVGKSELTHGFCPECIERYYPEIIRALNVPEI